MPLLNWIARQPEPWESILSGLFAVSGASIVILFFAFVLLIGNRR